MRVHQQRRVGRRELQVIDPVRACEHRLRLAGMQIDGEHDHRQPRGESARHLRLLVERLVDAVGLRGLSGLAAVVILAFADDVAADAEGFVGVDREDARAARQVGDLALLAGTDIGRP